jgi:hypothetical protein
MSSLLARIGSYEIPRELLDLRVAIRQISRDRIAPRAAEIDRTGMYPQDIRRLLADNDVLALPFSRSTAVRAPGR